MTLALLMDKIWGQKEKCLRARPDKAPVICLEKDFLLAGLPARSP